MSSTVKDYSPSISPGSVIKDYIIDGLNISVQELAAHLHVPANRIYLIMQDKRDISVDTAIRLSYFLNMEPEFWLDLQTRHHIYKAGQHSDSITGDIIPLAQLTAVLA